MALTKLQIPLLDVRPEGQGLGGGGPQARHSRDSNDGLVGVSGRGLSGDGLEAEVHSLLQNCRTS